MDIFGFYPQTVQGADILATAGSQKHRVLIPDWFEGEPADYSWYPPTDDDKKKKLGDFFGKNPPTRVAPLAPGFIKAAGEKYPSVKSWAILGVCSPPLIPHLQPEPKPESQPLHLPGPPIPQLFNRPPN